LANTYSFDYDWQSSQIYIYDMQSEIYNSTSAPLSIFPNYHQRLPKRFNPIFLNIVSSPISLALLDNDGNVLIFVPTPPGSFPSIENTGSMPLITSEQPCLPGTYKNQTGINDCILCPTNTKTLGDLHTYCTPCSDLSFCPLGSSNETSSSALNETITNIPYPIQSEITEFDAVLLNSIFGTKTSNCRIAPSLFYTLIIGGLVVPLALIMCIFKYCCKNSTIDKIRRRMKCAFKRIDFIDEGNYWLGGLLSLPLITLIVCTCAFSSEFIKLYPTENAYVPYLACDSTLVNAVFESNVKSLGLPQRNLEQKMIDLLDEQQFVLHVDFVNTLINCDAVEIKGLFGNTWSTLRWIDCTNVGSTLSISILLPHQHISVKILLDDIKTIGGLRIGLLGEERISEDYTLKKIHFKKAFYKNGYVLGKTIPLSLILTKVINETVPMTDETSKFSGIFIATFEADLNNILLSSNQYIFSTSSSVCLQISLTESSYYQKNLQKPMARKVEIVFHTILFIIICLELFSFIFLLYKLVLKPIYNHLRYYIIYLRRTESSSKTSVVLINVRRLSSQSNSDLFSIYSF